MVTEITQGHDLTRSNTIPQSPVTRRKLIVSTLRQELDQAAPLQPSQGADWGNKQSLNFNITLKILHNRRQLQPGLRTVLTRSKTHHKHWFSATSLVHRSLALKGAVRQARHLVTSLVHYEKNLLIIFFKNYFQAQVCSPLYLWTCNTESTPFICHPMSRSLSCVFSSLQSMFVFCIQRKWLPL